MAKVVAAAGAVAVLESLKNPANEGTWEDSDVAFQLYLGHAPQVFGSFGFHALPHVGTYDHADYTPALPIALVSVPLVDARAQLPFSVAELVEHVQAKGLCRTAPELYLMLHSGLDGPQRGVECGHLVCSWTAGDHTALQSPRRLICSS